MAKTAKTAEDRNPRPKKATGPAKKTPGSKRAPKWTAVEDRKLRDAVEPTFDKTAKHQVANYWDGISSKVGTRDARQCKAKWTKIREAAYEATFKNADDWSEEELSLLRKNINRGPKDLAEKIFPAKTRGPNNIYNKKLQIKKAIERLANGQVNQKLDLDKLFTGKEKEFVQAVEKNRTGRPRHSNGKKTIVWTGVAADVDIPHVDAATCERYYRGCQESADVQAANELSGKKRKSSRSSTAVTSLFKGNATRGLKLKARYAKKNARSNDKKKSAGVDYLDGLYDVDVSDEVLEDEMFSEEMAVSPPGLPDMGFDEEELAKAEHAALQAQASLQALSSLQAHASLSPPGVSLVGWQLPGIGNESSTAAGFPLIFPGEDTKPPAKKNAKAKNETQV